MKGLEISVTNNDLVIKQEERLVRLFVIFKDNKYGTKYIIFTDNVNKQLCYGSPLVNGDKMIVMKFNNARDEELVKQFVWDYLSGNISSAFEIVEVPVVSKLEVIDNNTLDVKEEYIDKLNDIFFKKEEVIDNGNADVKIKPKKSKGPILFALFLLICGIMAFLYLKNNPELIYGKDIYVECRKEYNIDEIDSGVSELVTLTFTNSQKLKKHENIITYSFFDNDKYYEFKEKNLNYKYVEYSGEELFIDNELSYKLFVNYNLNNEYKFPKNYDQIYDYFKNNGYSCNNIEK